MIILLNTHFVSFLLDVSAWLVVAYFLGKYIARIERFNTEKHIKLSLTLNSIAILGGFIATIDISLPTMGLSFYHFFVATLYMFIFSLVKYAQFRDNVSKFVVSMNFPKSTGNNLKIKI